MRNFPNNLSRILAFKLPMPIILVVLLPLVMMGLILRMTASSSHLTSSAPWWLLQDRTLLYWAIAAMTANAILLFMLIKKCQQALQMEKIVAYPPGYMTADEDISRLQHATTPTSENKILSSRLPANPCDMTDHSLSQNDAFLQTLINHLPVIIYVRSMRASDFGRTVTWNKTAEIATGYPTDIVLQQSPQDIFPSKFAALFAEIEKQMQTEAKAMHFSEIPFQHLSGDILYLNLQAIPLFDTNHQLEYVLAIAEDVTQSREQERELRAKQTELAAVNDASPLGLFHSDPRGKCTYVNRTYEIITGLSSKQAMGDGWTNAIHPQDRLKVFQAWGRSSDKKQSYQGSYRFLHTDGRIVWASVKASPIIVDGELKGFVGSIDDITLRVKSEQALRESEQRLRTIADTQPALVAYIDAEERFRFNNANYEKAYGVKRDAIRGKTVREFLGENEYRSIADYIRRVLAGENIQFEREKQVQNGYRYEEVMYIPHFSEEGKTVIGFHAMIQDISEKKLEEKRLLKLAQIDSLTGIVNHAGFQQRVADAVANSKKTKALIAIMYMDIDHFKDINDSHGHPVGDALLKAFVERLSRTIRSSDVVARLGGDEFTILMEKLTKPDDAATVAAKIVHAMQSPFILLDNYVVSISVSIGLAYYQGAPIDARALIKQADDMLYLAKRTGRNTYRIAPFLPCEGDQEEQLGNVISQ